MTQRREFVAALCLVLAPLTLGAQKAGRLSRMEVIVIADQSNRIAKTLHPGQLERDTAIIHMIADEFRNVVARNRFLFSRDRLRMVYVGDHTPPTEPRIDVWKMNNDRQVVVKALPGEIDRFVQEASRPYFTPKSNRGADIWSWFKNTAPVVFEEMDTSRVNDVRIILLTDGYLEFAPKIKREPGTAMQMQKLRGRSDWQSVFPSLQLRSVGHKIPNAKVLVLELAPLNPDVNTTEQEILQKYWSEWFKDMGMPTRLLANSVGLPTVRDVLRQFLAR